jgi:hypothetical protein
VVFGIELILTPPAELVFANGALHELAASSMSYEHLTSRAFLAPDELIQVTKQS